MTGPIVMPRHVRAARLCMRGARDWFARQDHLSWNVFLESGYPADAIEATGDALALRVAAIARSEHRG